MTKKYIRVDVHSESDLPKKDGEYIAHSKVSSEIDIWEFLNYSTFNYPDTHKEDWLKNIDWYLIEESQPVQNEQSDISKILKRFGYKLKVIIHNFHETFTGEWDMDEVISEFLKEEKVDQPTTEENKK